LAASSASKTTALGSAPVFLTNQIDARALRPNFQLLDGGGAKRVGGAQKNLAASPRKRCASLPMVVVLPHRSRLPP